ncbi:hypothetical protein BRC61_00870 [Halobacteriales archaeon QH_10_65_19]|nr:MAG: hypothetical protein BRC61_00870 [Halobacteriales archaeon QH_10_65_19]
MRSRRSFRSGEVYSPTVNPASRQIEASRPAVLPLPLEPAIWTAVTSSCGLPWWASSAAVVSVPSFGLSRRSRSNWFTASWYSMSGHYP